MSKIDEIEARWRKATKGPWYLDFQHNGLLMGVAPVSGRPHDLWMVAHMCEFRYGREHPNQREDAEAIAAAPEDIRILIERVRELEEKTLDPGDGLG